MRREFVQREPSYSMRTDGRTHTDLMVVFRSLSNTPKRHSFPDRRLYELLFIFLSWTDTWIFSKNFRYTPYVGYSWTYRWSCLNVPARYLLYPLLPAALPAPDRWWPGPEYWGWSELSHFRSCPPYWSRTWKMLAWALKQTEYVRRYVKKYGSWRIKRTLIRLQLGHPVLRPSVPEAQFDTGDHIDRPFVIKPLYDPYSPIKLILNWMVFGNPEPVYVVSIASKILARQPRNRGSKTGRYQEIFFQVRNLCCFQ